MEKHISKDNLSQIDFFCLQPLVVDDIINRKFLSKDYHPPASSWLKIVGDNLITEKEIKDKLKLNCMNSYWSSILQKENACNLYVHLFDTQEFNNNLIEELCYDENLELTALNNFYLNPTDTGFTLVFDQGTKSFIIIYHISILFDSKENKLSTFSHLYKKVRDIVVIDEVRNNPTKSEWSKFCENYSIKVIDNTVGIKAKNIKVLDSTGYIVSICNQENVEKLEYNFTEFKKAILLNNKFDDSLSNSFPELPQLSNNTPQIIYLGWLYSTIYGVSKKDIMSILTSLILHQNSFIQLKIYYRPYIRKMFKNVKYDFKYLDSSKYLRIFDSMLLSIKQVKQSHFDLTSRQKKWQSDLHYWVWTHWKIDKLFQELEESLTILESSINRKISYNSERVQRTQSNILFVLALLQLFTVSAIIKDYFELFSAKVPSGINQISQENFTKFTAFLPYILIMLSIFFILIVYRYDVMNLIYKLFRRKNKSEI